MKAKIIYLPIETKSREYHAKLLFACYAVKRGYQVVIGSAEMFVRSLHRLPQGIYVGTAMTEEQSRRYKRIREMKHRVVAFDEESLVYHNQDYFMQTRILEGTISEVDHFFTWGKHHSSLVHKKAPYLTNYTDVGNMRFELLKLKYHSLYNKQIKKLKQRYGEFVLLNTNFATYNNVVGIEFYYEMLKSIHSASDVDLESFCTGDYEHQKVIFKSYQSLITTLSSKFEGINIVIRPHPSENLETWKKLQLPNVHVVREGPVIPWILASKALLQKNCTTAVEAVFLNKPIITYSVEYDPRYDNETIKEIGELCETEIDVIKALSDLESLQSKIDADRMMLQDYVSNTEPALNTAYAALDVMDGIDVQAVTRRDVLRYLTKIRIHLFKKSVKDVRTAAFDTSKSEHLKNWRQKFPGLTKGEFLRDMRIISNIIDIDHKKIKCTKLYNKFFYISAKGEKQHGYASQAKQNT